LKKFPVISSWFFLIFFTGMGGIGTIWMIVIRDFFAALLCLVFSFIFAVLSYKLPRFLIKANKYFSNK